MAFSDVTKEYVDVLTYNKYASRTAETVAFEIIKDQMSVYLAPQGMPDKKITRGLALLVAHYYAMDDTQSPDIGSPDTEFGNITTERVGDINQTRGLQPYVGTIEGYKNYFLLSRYGVEFLMLMKSFRNNPILAL